MCIDKYNTYCSFCRMVHGIMLVGSGGGKAPMRHQFLPSTVAEAASDKCTVVTGTVWESGTVVSPFNYAFKKKLTRHRHAIRLRIEKWNCHSHSSDQDEERKRREGGWIFHQSTG